MQLTAPLSLVAVLSLALACTAAEPAKPDAKADAKADPKPNAKTDANPAPAAPATTPAAPAAPADAYSLVAGESLGPVRIGMKKAEVEALKFAVHPHFSAMTIPISVYYDDAELVKSVEISLAHTDKDVLIDAVTIPKAASVEQIRELLGDCEAPQMNIGATVHSCRAGKVLMVLGSGDPAEIWLRTLVP